MKNPSPVILAFKNRALGDSVISLGAIQYLKKNIPNAHIVFGVPSWVFPLFEQLDTAADKIIPVNLQSFSSWRSFYQAVGKLSPDMIIELFQSGRGKKFGAIYQALNWKTKYYGNNHHLDDGTYKKSNIQRDIDGIRSHLTSIPQGSFLDFCPHVKTKEAVVKKNKIIFGIVATRETKLWPIQHYHQLAQKILATFPHAEIQIPVSDNSLDQRLMQEFRGLGEITGVSFLQTGLRDLPIDLASGKIYIGNDTGIKHLCIALGLKSISFFGPEPPVEWHPYNQNEHPFYYIDNLECRTQTAHFCGLSTCDSMICLNQISAERVFIDNKKILEEILC